MPSKSKKVLQATIRMAMEISTGLKELPPRPPKICFPITMATRVPTITAHHGMVAGSSMPSSSPMRAALPSPMETGRLDTRLNRYSQMMAEEMAREITPRAGMP